MKQIVPMQKQSVEARTQPPGEGQGLESKAQSLKSKVRGPKARLQRLKAGGEGRSLESKSLSLRSEGRCQPAAVGYLAGFLCAVMALALLVTGCAGPRPLKGGKAVTTHKAAGVTEQTLLQGENPAQATRQAEETVRIRTYTVPAGSRVEQPQTPGSEAAQPGVPAPAMRPPSTINSQPSTIFTLNSPMPVVEREETRARTELGAAQKDTARELGARLSSLKGIVWVGVGLFVFGLASLVWPPLKAVIASVTTSAALMIGGVALMVLPSLIVGNELLILGVVGVAVGGWFLAHRHGHLRGMVAAGSKAPGGRASLGGRASPRAQTSDTLERSPGAS